MSYSCYLGGVEWPTPEKLQLKIKGKNKTLVLLNEGEVNFLRAPGLTELVVPFDLPMLTGAYSPDRYLGILENLKANRETTQFILVRASPSGRSLFDTNMKVSVEDYTITEEGKNGLDVSIDVNLKQWRDRDRGNPAGPGGEHADGDRGKGAGREHRSNGQDLHGKGRRLPLGHCGQILWQRGRVQQNLQRKHGQGE